MVEKAGVLVRIVIQTRFSFLGKSGWRSAASKQAELLLDPARLENRFRFFQEITLKTLHAQTDKNFDWIVLGSRAMPRNFRQRLTELVGSMNNTGMSKVIFRKPQHAGDVFRTAVQNWFPANELISSVVLDDDDGLSDDFVASCRMVVEKSWETRAADDDYIITSFPRGYSLDISQSKCKISQRNVPFTNLGLTLTAPAASNRNLFFMSHKKISERRPNTVVERDEPYYIRAVHDHNDSRAIIRDDAHPVGFAEVQMHFSGIDFHNLEE